MSQNDEEMLRQALLPGITVRLRMTETQRSSAVYLQVRNAFHEIEWSADVREDRPIETALMELFRIAAVEILENGARAFEEDNSAPRPLPRNRDRSPD